jgi:homoserine O-succinyltransferase/O-acetyltransferase
MPVTLRSRANRCLGPPPARTLRIGLVNNMPDSALEGTEHQFTALLSAAGFDRSINLIPYALPEVRRGDWGRRYVEERYFSVAELWDAELDALIVTGAEPQTNSLRDETYWSRLIEVLVWAQASEKPVILSCLAAQVAVLYFDGIARVPLSEKRLGVFEHEVVSRSPFTRDVAQQLRMPHSRWNDLPSNALAAGGYQILTQSREAGVDCFAKAQKRLWLFFQGHPEYEGDSLLKEYVRDVNRFLKCELETYPGLPNDYFPHEVSACLIQFRDRALACRDEAIMADFPLARNVLSPNNTWRESGAKIYRNWLSYVAEAP